MLGRLKALAALARERGAGARTSRAAGSCSDETLADLASHPPKEQGDLAKVRGLSAGVDGQRYRRAADEGARQGRAAAARRNADKPKRGAPLGKEGALVADLLKLLLKIRSREIDVAAALLTRSDELEALAAGAARPAGAQGWRYEVFGRDALDLVEGRLGFGVENGKLKMTRIDDVVADRRGGRQADAAE